MEEVRKQENRIIFITEDFNFELNENVVNITRMNASLNSFSFLITNNKYTRTTITSISCIDNIFANFDGSYSTNILQVSLSDDNAQKLSFTLPAVDKADKKLVRIYSEGYKKQFVSRILNTNWDKICSFPKEDDNKQWN